MRIAIISDIHSNLEALNAVLEKAASIGYDELICLGDIVGYGPDPEPCLDIVFDNAKMIIKGNHESAVVAPELLAGFNPFARESILWTIENISEKYFRFLSYLKSDFTKNNILFVHGSPGNPEKWNYISSSYDAEKYFSEMVEPLCFIGHSHVAGVYKDYDSTEILKSGKTIINVGSVGQPRDGNKNASFGLFDTDRWIYSNFRVKYDFEKTREKIIKNRLPQFLADRLLKGL